MNDLNTLNLKLSSLAIFRSLLKTPVIIAFENLVSKIGDLSVSVKLYTEFVSELYHYYDNFSDYLFNYVLEDENFYIKAKASGENVDDIVETALLNELAVLQELSRLQPSDVTSHIKYDGFLPGWNTSEYDFASSYKERLLNISQCGFGFFSKYHMFTISGEKIVPVKFHDQISLSSFSGYDREREVVIKNTAALLDRGGASNILLYGDAGTGKSSTVKAIVNHFYYKGLRLIEIKKHQLFLLPDILEQLADNPLKFILFIDDLSFMQNDDNFTALKAYLEGSVSARSNNVVIYATSNRRHLVKEKFSDRDGDEIHVNDLLQEIMGLSARFGLTVTFQKPDKDAYLSIVRHIAKEYGIAEDERLIKSAEAFALRNNGRSPRTAKQFIELLKSDLY